MEKELGFATSDLQVAAYLLSRGEKIKKKTPTGYGRVRFVFEGTKDRLEKEVLDYNNGATVEAKRLMDHYRTMISMAKQD